MSSERKKVFFLMLDFAGGGAERVMLTIVRHLDRTEFEPILVVVARRGAFVDDIPGDVPVYELGRIRYAVPKLIALVHRLKPHTLFSTLGPLNLAVLILRPFMPGVRFVVRESTVVSEKLWDGSYRPRWLWKFLYRLLYPRADLVICPSKYMLEDLAVNFGIPRERLKQIYNPIDLEHVRSMAREGKGEQTNSIPEQC